jgi:ADP-heptose:LPS heptosyltransferase
VDRSNAVLLPYLGRYHDEAHVFPQGNKYLAVIKTGLKHRGCFDVAISAKGGSMKLLDIFLYALGANERIAGAGPKWHTRLLTRPRDLGNIKARHQAATVLRLLVDGLESVPPEFYPRLEIPAESTSRWRPQVLESLAPLSRPRLLVSVTNNRPTSTLQMEKLARLLNSTELPAHSVVISCEPKDEACATQLQSQLATPSAVCPTQTLEHFLVLLANVDAAFIGDGGVTHMAAALDKPQLALFGRTNPTVWHPLSQRAQWLYDAEDVNSINEAAILDGLKRLFSAG